MRSSGADGEHKASSWNWEGNLVIEMNTTAQQSETSLQGSKVESKTVRVTAVKPGDIVKNRIVATVKSGPKWTYLRDDAGKTISEARNETSVTVDRPISGSRPGPALKAVPEPTIEEMRAHANSAIERKLASRKEVFEQIRFQVLKDLEQENYLGGTTLGILLTAQADLKILDEFSALVDFASDGADLVTLQKEFAQRLMDRLVSSTRNRTIVHNEESAVTHLLDECTKESIARFIESARWYL